MAIESIAEIVKNESNNDTIINVNIIFSNGNNQGKLVKTRQTDNSVNLEFKQDLKPNFVTQAINKQSFSLILKNSKNIEIVTVWAGDQMKTSNVK